MKNIFFLFLFFNISFVYGTTAHTPWEQAEALMKNNCFDEARALYETLNIHSSSVLEAIGNCYAAEGKHAPALVFWERAARIASSPFYVSKIAYLIKTSGGDIPNATKIAWYVMSSLRWGKLPLLIFILLLWCLLCIFFVNALYKRFLKRSFVSGALLTINLMLVFVILKEYDKRGAYVTFVQSSVRISPESTATVAFQLTNKTRCEISAEKKDWAYVRMGDKKGWIKSEELLSV